MTASYVSPYDNYCKRFPIWMIHDYNFQWQILQQITHLNSPWWHYKSSGKYCKRFLFKWPSIPVQVPMTKCCQSTTREPLLNRPWLHCLSDKYTVLQNCIALDKALLSTKKYLYFSYFSTKTYPVALKKRLAEALLMSTHNIRFRWEIRKLVTWYPLLSRPMKRFSI